MLSFLVWLRLHPVTLLLGYGISWGWFDGLFAALPEGILTLPKFHHVTPHHVREAVVPLENSSVTVSSGFTVSSGRRLEEKHYTFNAGQWHDAKSEFAARFVCQIKAENGACPNPSYESDPGACTTLKNQQWEYREVDDFSGGTCYVAPLGVGPTSEGDYDWYGSKECCESVGAKLVSISDESTNKFVLQLCSSRMKERGHGSLNEERPHLLSFIHEVCWIGLSLKGSRWVWEDGTVLGSDGNWKVYQNFDGYEGHEKEETEDKAFIIPIDASWDDGGWMIVIIIIATLVGIVISIIAHVIYAWQYKKKVTDQRPPLPAVDSGLLDPSLVIMHDFKYGLCDSWCWQDCDMCLSVWLCLQSRIADTHQTAGTGKSYWFIFWVFEFAFFMEQFINAIEGLIRMDLNPGWIFAGLIRCCIMVRMRQELRKKFAGPQSSACNDFIIWWCCGYCAACQESRQVDEAQGRKVRCCCNMMEWRPQPPMGHMAVAMPMGQPGVVTVVGQPVQGQPIVGQPVGTQMGQMNPNMSTDPVKVPQGTVVQAQAVPVQASVVQAQAVPLQGTVVQAQAVPVQAQVVQAPARGNGAQE